ncbi:MAG: imidazolonepropionase [Planctomycetes bacterium]|nr:imidazolonepropionase [Planctomycetota bacterium]
MAGLTIINARILTLAGEAAPRRGDALRELGVIECGFVRIQDGRIAEVAEGQPESQDEVIDAVGCVLMPAFVDCHTHACWAGERFDEFQMKLAGASYLEILEAGGGIMATVRAVRAAPQTQLADKLLHRLGRMAALGTATVEVKSGYGLTTHDELKMLRAIREAASRTTQKIVPTFLGAHAIDPENPNFVDETINETLPAVVNEFGPIVCDAYCEQGAWSVDDSKRLFQEAQSLGCPIRVHADQFNSLGMTRLAVEMGAISVDHLEATIPADLECLAKSDTIAVALPACGFHLDDRYAPVRELVDAGGALAIATNYNPGSAPTPSMPFVIALGCRRLHLTPAEAIVASTVNAACVLGLQDELATIEVGKRADLQLLDCTDERQLAYEFATTGPRLVIIDGRIVHRHEPRPQGNGRTEAAY